MKRTTDYQPEKLIKSYKRRGHLRRAVALLSAVVLLLTINSLKMDADTLQRTPMCGLEEHAHATTCYPLICGQAESEPVTELRRFYVGHLTPHFHTEDCLDKNGEIACGYVEGEYWHVHNRYCYDDDGNLVCGLKERRPHEHTEACYEDVATLACGLEEFPAHHHGEECYAERRELTCGVEENPGHQHTDECYNEYDELTCGLEENPGHQHTDACYTEYDELTCTLEENPGHQHTDKCYKEYDELTCGVEENPGHQHSEACYEEYDELTCDIEENPGHQHGEECYGQYEMLTCGMDGVEGHEHTADCYTLCFDVICGIPEGEGAHYHGEECYTHHRDLVCGKEEGEGAHRHNGDCYTHHIELACGIPEGEGAHTHGGDCYTHHIELACGMEEGEGAHTHGEECYTHHRDLVCGMEEGEGAHTHNDDCYTTYIELVCDQEETEGHTHNEDCYLHEDVLVCGLDEAERVARNLGVDSVTLHTHSDQCFETVKVRVDGEKVKRRLATCGCLEIPWLESTKGDWVEAPVVVSEGHKHTEACYDLTAEPICGLVEHQHTDACFQQRPEKTEPVEALTEAPADEQTEAPTDEQTEEPADEQTEAPADEQTEAPVGEQTEAPAAEQTEAPADEQTEAPADEQTEEPADEQTEEPAGEQTEEPADEQTEEPTDKPTEVGIEAAGIGATEEPTEVEIETAAEPVVVSVDLSSVDLMDAATIEGSTVSLNVGDLLTGEDDAVNVEGDLSVDGAEFVENATVTAADVDIQDGVITLTAEALEKGSVSLEVQTTETVEDADAIVTTVTTHTVDIELTGYAGRAEEVSENNVTVTALEGGSLPGDAVVTLDERAEVPEGILDAAPVKENETEKAEGSKEAEEAVASNAVSAQIQQADETAGVVEGAAACDITITNANGDEIAEPGPVAVTVSPTDINVYSELPDGAVPVGEPRYALYRSHDGEAPVELDVDVEIDENGNIVSYSFETDRFSTYTLKYTVDFEYVNGEGVVNLDFTGFDAVTAEDGDAILYDTAECSVHVTADMLGNMLRNAVDAASGVGVESVIPDGFDFDFERAEQVGADGGAAFADGRLTVTTDGSVALTDGAQKLRVNISGLSALREELLKAEGVRIEVVEGRIPLGSAASYEKYSEEDAQALADAYLASGEAGEEASDEETGAPVAGYAAADLKIVRNGETLPAEGQFRVTVEKSSLIPEGMKLDKLYHIHNGEVEEVEVEVTEADLVFEVTGFSDIVASYTVEFHNRGVEYVVAGGSQFLLSPVISALRLIREDNGASFTVDDVVGVAFDTPELFDVAEVVESPVLVNGEPVALTADHDFLLTSLQPFVMDYMTLTLTDGATVRVMVTDSQNGNYRVSFRFKEADGETSVPDPGIAGQYYVVITAFINNATRYAISNSTVDFTSTTPIEFTSFCDNNDQDGTSAVYDGAAEISEVRLVTPTSGGAKPSIDQSLNQKDGVTALSMNGSTPLILGGFSLAGVSSNGEFNVTGTRLPAYTVVSQFKKDGADIPHALAEEYYLVATNRVDANNTGYYIETYDPNKTYAIDRFFLSPSGEGTGYNAASYNTANPVEVYLVRKNDVQGLYKARDVGDGQKLRSGTVDCYTLSETVDSAARRTTLTFTQAANANTFVSKIKFFNIDAKVIPASKGYLHVDEDDSNTKLEAPALTKHYYMLATLYDGSNHILGWAVNPISPDGRAETDTVFYQFYPFGDDGSERSGDMLGYMPSSNTIRTRLYRTDNPLSTENQTYKKLVTDGAGVDAAEDGYEFCGNFNVYVTGTTTVDHNEIHIKKGYEKDYMVRLRLDDAAVQAIAAGEKYYVFVKVEHANIHEPYSYAYRLIDIDPAAITDRDDDGYRYVDCEFDHWRDGNGDIKSDSATNCKFTGNEVGITVELVKHNNDQEFKPNQRNGNASTLIEEGSALLGYKVHYDTRENAGQDSITGYHEISDTDNHHMTCYDVIDLITIKADSDYDYATILGPNMIYGIVADHLNHGNDLQTNFAVNHYSAHGHYASPDLSGTSSGSIVIGEFNVTDGSYPNAVGPVAYDSTWGQLKVGNTLNGTLVVYADNNTGYATNVECSDPGKVIVVHADGAELSRTMVEPNISYGVNISNALFRHPETFIPPIESNTHAVIDTTAFADDATIYLDGDRYVEVLKTGGGLEIHKLDNQTIVFNFATSKNVDINQFKVYQPKFPKGFTTETDTANGTANNQKMDEISRHIVWNLHGVTGVTNINIAGGIFLQPNNLTQININGTSGGWIVSRGLVSNSTAEWHNFFADMPDTNKVSLNALKTIDGKIPRAGQKFNFYLDEYDTSAAGHWRDVQSDVNNTYAAVSFTPLENLTEGWHVFRIHESRTVTEPAVETTYEVAEGNTDGLEPGLYVIDTDVYYAAVYVHKTQVSAFENGVSVIKDRYVVTGPDYYKAFDPAQFTDPTDPSKLPGVSGDKYTVASFDNKAVKRGLSIEKQVEGTTDTTRKFVFEIELWKGSDGSRTPINDAEANYELSGVAGQTSVKVSPDGDHSTATLTLRNGQRATIEGLPVGTSYSISEIRVEGEEEPLSDSAFVNGYKRLTANPQTGSIASDSDIKLVTFRNKYAAAGDVQIHASKTLTDVEGNANSAMTLSEGQFSFTLSGANVNPTPANGTVKGQETVTNNADGSVHFEALHFTEADLDGAPVLPNGKRTRILMYTVHESDGTLANFDYYKVNYDGDKALVVLLTDNGDGTITATALPVNFTVAFSNTYEEKANATLQADKVLTGRDMSAGEFSFDAVLTQTKLPDPEHEGQTVVATYAADSTGDAARAAVTGVSATRVTGVTGASATETVDGEVVATAPITFPELTFTQEGEYTYTITENTADLADDVEESPAGQTYTAVITVTRTEDPETHAVTRSASVAYFGAGGAPVNTGAVTFTNTQKRIGFTVTKEWLDDQNQPVYAPADGTAPTIRFSVTRDGLPYAVDEAHIEMASGSGTGSFALDRGEVILTPSATAWPTVRLKDVPDGVYVVTEVSHSSSPKVDRTLYMLDGVRSEIKPELTGDDALTIMNTAGHDEYTGITVVKKWSDGSNEYVPTRGNITFELWAEVATSTDAELGSDTAKVKNDYKNANETLEDDVTIGQYIVMTVKATFDSASERELFFENVEDGVCNSISETYMQPRYYSSKEWNGTEVMGSRVYPQVVETNSGVNLIYRVPTNVKISDSVPHPGSIKLGEFQSSHVVLRDLLPIDYSTGKVTNRTQVKKGTYTVSATNNWTRTINGLLLSRTEGTDETNYKYYVKEVSTAGHYQVEYSPEGLLQDGVAVSSGMVTGGTITITNTRESTSLTVEKQWKYAGVDFSWPTYNDGGTAKDVQVEATLYKTVNGVKSAVDASDLAGWGSSEASNPAVLTGSASSATWDHLPMTENVNGTEYNVTYSAEETGVTGGDFEDGITTVNVAQIMEGGYKVTFGSVVSVSGTTTTIYNVELVEKEIYKNWANQSDLLYANPDDLIITVRLRQFYADSMEETTASRDRVSPFDDRVLVDNHRKWENLPSWGLEDGVLVRYEYGRPRETSITYRPTNADAWAYYYSIAKEDADTTTTNYYRQTKVEVRKVWDQVDTIPENLELTLTLKQRKRMIVWEGWPQWDDENYSEWPYNRAWSEYQPTGITYVMRYDPSEQKYRIYDPVGGGFSDHIVLDRYELAEGSDNTLYELDYMLEETRIATTDIPSEVIEDYSGNSTVTANDYGRATAITVTNGPYDGPRTNLTISKEWYLGSLEGTRIDAADLTDPAFAKTFDVYRTTTDPSLSGTLVTDYEESLIGGATKVREGVALPTADGAWSVTLENLVGQDSEGHAYYYFVVEQDAGSDTRYVLSGSTEGNTTAAAWTVKNVQEVKDFSVEKKWFVDDVEESTGTHEPITFDLYRTTETITGTGSGNAESVSVVIQPNQHNGYNCITEQTVQCAVGDSIKFKLTSNNFIGSTYEFNGVIKDVENDITYTGTNHWSYWYASQDQYVEIEISKATTLDISVYSISTVSYEGIIKGDNAASVITHQDLTAIAEKELVGSYTVSASDSPAWTKTFQNLPKYADAARTQEYTYFAVERVPAGYEDTYAFDAAGNAVVKNSRHTDENGSLTVGKSVLGISGDPKNVSQAFTFGLYVDAAATTPVYRTSAPTIPVTCTVALSEAGAGVETIENLPYGTYYLFELDKDGQPITNGSGVIGDVLYEVTNSGTAVTVNSGTGDTDADVTVTNKEKPYGSLTIRKIIDADFRHPVNENYEKASGTYRFTVSNVDDPEHPVPVHTVAITVVGNNTSHTCAMTGATIDGFDVTDDRTKFDASTGVTLSDLLPGEYAIQEIDWTLTDYITENGKAVADMALKKVMINGVAVPADKRTVTVTAESGATIDAEFTNELVPTKLVPRKLVADFNDSWDEAYIGTTLENPRWDSADYDAGDLIPYRIKVNLPQAYLKSCTSYYYKIYDEMTRMTYNTDIEPMHIFAAVKDDETTEWYQVDYFFTFSANGNKKTITAEAQDLKAITWGYRVTNWGGAALHSQGIFQTSGVEWDTSVQTPIDVNNIDCLEMRYWAKLDNDAFIGQAGTNHTGEWGVAADHGNPNAVRVEYSNKVGTDEHGFSDWDVNKVFTYQLSINKTDADGDPLTGSNFLLYKQYQRYPNSSNTEKIPAEGWSECDYDNGAGQTVKLIGPTGELPSGATKTAINDEKVYDSTVYVRVRKASGDVGGSAFAWPHVDDGCYLLVETNTPSNYDPLPGPILFKIEARHELESDDPQLTYLDVTEATIGGEDVTGKYITFGSDMAKTGVVTGAVKNYQTGSLKVTKAVTDADSRAAAADTTFDFSVTLTPPTGVTLYTSMFTVTPASAVTWGAADQLTGAITGRFSITGTNSVTIGGIPAGTTYTVTEADHDGWIQTGTANSDAVTPGTVSVDDADEVTVTNAIPGKLRVAKAVTVGNRPVTDANKALTDGTYTFQVKGPSPATDVVATVAITMKDGAMLSATGGTQGDGYVEIGNLVPGTYTITETGATNLAMSLAAAQTVTVRADVTGVTPVPATFTNNFDTTSVSVTKQWIDASDEETDWPGEVVSVSATLLANGETADVSQEDNLNAATVTLTGESPSASWANLPVKDANGDPIAYTVKETAVTVKNAKNEEKTYTESGDIRLTDVVDIVSGNPVSVSGGQATIQNRLYRADISVVKIDWNTREDQTPKPLANAQFTLAQKTGPNRDDYTVYPDSANATKTTDGSGRLEFTNLPAGYYRLEETRVPSGYIRTGRYIYFMVSGNTVTWKDGDGNTITNQVQVLFENGEFTVGNEPGVALPATGGMGTGAVYAAGAALLALAVLGLIWKGRKRCSGDGID